MLLAAPMPLAPVTRTVGGIAGCYRSPTAQGPPLAHRIPMRRFLWPFALFVGLAAPDTAFADDSWSFVPEVDLGFKWLNAPPSLQNSNGLSSATLAQPTGPADFGIWHGGFLVQRGPLRFPLAGFEFGFGGTSYGPTAQTPTYKQDGPAWMSALTFPGVGLQVTGAWFHVDLTAVPALELLGTPGQVSVAGTVFGVGGIGASFAVRTRLDVCVRDEDVWWCVVGGPTFLEGSALGGGGYVGIGAHFDNVS